MILTTHTQTLYVKGTDVNPTMLHNPAQAPSAAPLVLWPYLTSLSSPSGILKSSGSEPYSWALLLQAWHKIWTNQGCISGTVGLTQELSQVCGAGIPHPPPGCRCEWTLLPSHSRSTCPTEKSPSFCPLPSCFEQAIPAIKADYSHCQGPPFSSLPTSSHNSVPELVHRTSPNL